MMCLYVFHHFALCIPLLFEHICDLYEIRETPFTADSILKVGTFLHRYCDINLKEKWPQVCHS